jgi:hypothetical protein
MDNKLMAQVFSDIIASAMMPVVVNGEVYKEHRMTVTLDGEAIEAMLYAMKWLWCKSVSFGSYGCYEDTINGASVDGCLVGEVNKLLNSGIKTIGCCCGHAKRQGYIQVAPESAEAMNNLRYEQLPIDADGNGQWCFKPKTLLP